MTNILVNFCNIILDKGYYLERWTIIVDVILEKGKGLKLSKLRTITSIERDLQILIRIFLDPKEQALIENDSMFSKVNYGLRRNYSIEIAI